MACYARGCAAARPASRPLRTFASARASSSSSTPVQRRQLHPIRLSTYFQPTHKASSSASGDDALASLQLLLRGGYIRSSSSGVFTLLPNALRIVRKLTAIIDDELHAIGASRLAMPTLLPAKLWRQTGRYEIMGSELYKLRDRRDAEYVLGPTHEEEVTRLVAGHVESDRQLPVRVYQVTRKFRDEPRPRMGLLRTKEFLMKDLYSFDKSAADAARAYDDVTAAYTCIFDRIFTGADGRRWVAAEADTGAIGGNKSHEYHVQDAAGEDRLITCSKCGYAANTEKAVSMPDPQHMPISASDVRVLLYACPDLDVHDTPMHALVLPATRELNAVKAAKLSSSLAPATQLLYDSASPQPAQWDWKDRPEGPLLRYSTLAVLADFECASLDPAELNDALATALSTYTSPSASSPPASLAELFPAQFGGDTPVAPALTLVDVRTAQQDDTCSSCKSIASLQETRAIEVGHTFFLGDRYSRALEAGFLPTAATKAAAGGVMSNGRVPFQMGCYGIGVSRILGALAQKAASDFTRATSKAGLLWPRQASPFTAAILIADVRDSNKLEAATRVYDALVSKARTQDLSIHAVLARILGGNAQDDLGWSSDEAHEVVIDDRRAQLGAKLADADLTGYTYRLIIGRHLHSHSPHIEVQHLTPTGLDSVLVPLETLCN
jgi:prolyl-tRNA synthetase